MKSTDPVGDPLGRSLERLVSPSLGQTPEEKAATLEMMERTDPLRRLGISNRAPKLWKSVLWWGILGIGMTIALYMSFHQK
jgi:hypothetical protein